jgi:hypothetical protein
MQTKDLFEEFVRELKDCEPLDRQPLAAGYARTVDLRLAEALQTLHTMLLTQPTDDVIEALELAIEELQTGKSVVGTTEGITGKLAV